ncbi:MULTISPECIES: inorganic pyrophosphatase [unclassified Mannheimia]|uniref:inorganic pyrophosphatase n=1 Tax=unclassified Mannheimia TaxID=2645054 RepID=UPI00359E0EED
MTQETAKHRIQDPILNQLAQGYHNAELVADMLMPVVEIPKEAGKIPQFGRLAFRQQSTVRQLHGDSNRLTPEDITTINVELEEHDIEYPIDYREEQEASYQLKEYALNVTQDVIALGRELEVAGIAQNADNYDTANKISLAAKAKFSNLEADPIPVFDTAINAISTGTGRKPNVCIIAGDVWEMLKQNKTLLERIKYTRTAILTPEVFAELIGVKYVKIGGAMKEESGELKKIWSDCVILAYVSPLAIEKKGKIYEPSYGYTVRRKGGLFVDTYKEKGGKVEIIRCTDIHKPHLVGKSAGYLIKDCLTR